MVNRNLLRQYDLPETELTQELDLTFNREDTGGNVDDWLTPKDQEFEVNKIVTGRVISIVGDEVLVDVGYKSEGVIPARRMVRRRSRPGGAAPSPATRSRSCSKPWKTKPAPSS